MSSKQSVSLVLVTALALSTAAFAQGGGGGGSAGGAGGGAGSPGAGGTSGPTLTPTPGQTDNTPSSSGTPRSNRHTTGRNSSRSGCATPSEPSQVPSVMNDPSSGVPNNGPVTLPRVPSGAC